MRTSVRVDDAVEINPFRNARVVEVACSLVESLVNGQPNVPAPPQPEHDETTKLPIVAEFAKSSVVDARPETKRLVVVADVPVAFVKVRF